MSEEKKKHIKIEDGNTEAEEAKAEAKAEEAKVEEKAPEEAEKEAPAEETAGEEKTDEAEAAEKAAAEAESERYMRLMAEFQNYKKRAAKEKTDTLQYANEKIVSDLLPVIDNFERALATETDDLEGYAKGMQLIFEQFKKALENAGLEEIKAEDEVFDPNVHNAVMAENVEDKEDGVITKVLQKGYKLRDKVVRPSMVAVNKK
ncbi:MAG: nucleotide exchange factor GrpE [Clostridiales bacterium]|nr:nucleotide exchange factor GrpE [Clostridiales bacterium]